MLLAIDSGNTNAVFGVYDGDTLRASWRVSTNARRTGDEYAVWLTQLLALAGLARTDIDATIIANVVPEARFNLLSLCRQYLNLEPLVVGTPSCRLGIGVDVDMPAERVGGDRLANAVAARDRYKTPLMVIDFGTTTNFDIVDHDGNFCGGIIAPGPNLSLQALQMATAQLPLVAIEKLIVVIIGLALVGQGAHRSFMKYLRTSQMSPKTRRAVEFLGVIGTIARGLVFALAGALVIDAAITHKASESGGIDKALLTLRDQPLGEFLMLLAALGLAVFGVYGLCEARWRRV
jgi:type III pantothenate kinase